jgi:hypothetical protein
MSMHGSTPRVGSSTPTHRNSEWPSGSRYLRLYATPRMARAVWEHQRDADAIASRRKRHWINRLHAVALPLDAYLGKIKRLWPPLGRRGEK